MKEVQRKGGTREALWQSSAVPETNSESARPMNLLVANPARSLYTGTSGPRTIKGQRASQAHLSFPALRERRVLGLGLPSSHLEYGQEGSQRFPVLLVCHTTRESQAHFPVESQRSQKCTYLIPSVTCPQTG